MSMAIERNYLTELFRFLAAISIAVFHFEYLYIGSPVYMIHEYIWVEFFFCLSGYFLAGSKKCHPEQEPIPYVVSKAKKLYPLYFISFALNFALLCFVNRYTLSGALHRLWANKWELLFLTMSGFSQQEDIIYGGAPSYISAMLLASLVLYWLLGKHEKLFSNVLGPLMALACYTRILLLAGNLSQWTYVDNFFTFGFLRAIAGMSTGALSFLWLRPLFNQAKEQTHYAGIFQKAGLVFSLFMLWCLIRFSYLISAYDLVFYVFVFAVLLPICDTVSIKCPAGLKKTALELGRLSYPLFLIHTFVISILKLWIPLEISGRMYVLFLLCAILAAKGMLLLEARLKLLSRFTMRKLKAAKENLPAEGAKALRKTATQQQSGDRMYYGLNLFRIFLMVWILLFHGRIRCGFAVGNPTGDLLINLGAVCVTGFFMTSGFVLRHTWGSRLDSGGSEGRQALGQYIWKRVSGIYPVYLFMMLAAFLTNYRVPLNFGMFLPINLCLLQTFDHVNNFYFLFNDNCWYLATAFVLYMLFPLLNRLLNLVMYILGQPKFRTVLLVFLILTVVSEYFYWFYAFTLNSQFLSYYAHPLYRIPEFMAGMLLSDLLLYVPNTWKKWSWTGVLAGLGLLFIGMPKLTSLMNYLQHPFADKFNLYNIILLPAFGLIILALCSLSENSLLYRIGKNRITSYCAGLTFACYLSQSFSIQLLDSLVASGTVASGLKVQCAFFALTIIAAVILHHAVEIPGKYVCDVLARRGRKQ